MKFRKKPVVIDAWLWDETKTTFDSLVAAGMKWNRHDGHFRTPELVSNLRINTLEGGMEATKGDWIIKGVKGEFYPCKPDIFEATYDSADDQQPTMLEVVNIEHAHRYATELDAICDILTRVHPIGEVKYIGRLEAAAALLQLFPEDCKRIRRATIAEEVEANKAVTEAEKNVKPVAGYLPVAETIK